MSHENENDLKHNDPRDHHQFEGAGWTQSEAWSLFCGDEGVVSGRNVWTMDAPQMKLFLPRPIQTPEIRVLLLRNGKVFSYRGKRSFSKIQTGSRSHHPKERDPGKIAWPWPFHSAPCRVAKCSTRLSAALRTSRQVGLASSASSPHAMRPWASALEIRSRRFLG